MYRLIAAVLLATWLNPVVAETTSSDKVPKAVKEQSAIKGNWERARERCTCTLNKGLNK